MIVNMKYFGTSCRYYEAIHVSHAVICPGISTVVGFVISGDVYLHVCLDGHLPGYWSALYLAYKIVKGLTIVRAIFKDSIATK